MGPAAKLWRVTIEIRALQADELHGAHAAFTRALQFETMNAEHFDRRRPLWWAERSFGAFENGTIVGHAGGIPFQTRLPGGTDVATDGVTRVGVLPTHRRRGILTALMHHQLRAAFERGEPLASLRASESVIYGRFGYGLAGLSAHVRIDTAATRFLVPAPTSGSFHYLRESETLDVIPPLYERCRRRPGSLSRPASLFAFDLDPLVDAEKEDRRWLVVHRDERGRPDGYVDWEAIDREHWEEKGARIELNELWGVSDDVEAQLWRFLFDLDLVHEVVCEMRPIDDALRWRLADVRAFKVMDVFDEQWLRLVDVSAVLGARTYAGDDSIVIEVTHDPVFEHNLGRFEVSNAGCRRVRRAPDVRLDVAGAGAVALGGTSFDELLRSGRIDEARRGGVDRADRLFASRPKPFCGTFF